MMHGRTIGADLLGLKLDDADTMTLLTRRCALPDARLERLPAIPERGI